MSNIDSMLTPYDALKSTTYHISRQLRGVTATVNYGDVGIEVKRDTDGPHAGKDKFFKTHAITINGTNWLIGALAPDFERKNSFSYLYGFEYNWESVFNRTAFGSIPRLMPPEPPLPNHLNQLFSEINAYIINREGTLGFSENNKGAFNSRKVVNIIRSNIRSIDGKIWYEPNLPFQLAPVLYEALAKMEALTRTKKSQPLPTKL
jgi:hypothetical protein